MKLKVPDTCLPLLREQRTCYTDHAREYGEEIDRTFEGIRRHLPDKADLILDIGAGMAGIDVFLGRHYPSALFVLLDKHGVSDRINAGFNESAEQFAHYNDFGAAIDLLEANDISGRAVCHDISCQPFPDAEFDVVISLLSWGFHYPISTYAPRCRGVMVVDVRKGTSGEDELREYGDLTVVHDAKKYRRVVVQC